MKKSKPVKPTIVPTRFIDSAGKWGCYLKTAWSDTVEILKIIGACIGFAGLIILYCLIWIGIAMSIDDGSGESFLILPFGIVVFPLILLLLYNWFKSIKERCQ